MTYDQHSSCNAGIKRETHTFHHQSTEAMSYKDNGPAYSLQEDEKQRISLVPLDRQEQKYFGRSPIQAQVL